MKNFKSVNQIGQIVKPAQEQELDVWSLPSIASEVVDDEKTNAFGKKSTWKYEPPEADEPEIVPLTAEEIEEIHQAAHDEGFNQGKEEGFSAGFDEGKRSGHEEGLKEGHEEGLAAGLAEGQEQIEQLIQQWKMLTEQLYQPLKVIEHNVEHNKSKCLVFTSQL